MRDTFVATLLKLAKKDKNIHIITGDLGFGVLKPFWEELPNQITNVGIAEQNMTGFATGLALEGKIVFTYSIGNFPTLRTLEQIRNDAAYHEANVKIVCVGAGFAYGSLGMSHHATEDLAIMSAIPNIEVLSPSDKKETEEATEYAYKNFGVKYLRLGRGGGFYIHQKNMKIDISKINKISAGNKIAIISTGSIIDEVLKSKKILEKNNLNPSIYSVAKIKPLNIHDLKEISKEHKYIISVEEHNIIGGLGSTIANAIVDLNLKVKLKIAIMDQFSSKVGEQSYLRSIYKIDAERIVKECLNIYEE